jgi:hypothetical protein
MILDIGKVFKIDFKRCTTNITTDGYCVDTCYTCSDPYILSLIMYFINNEISSCFFMKYCEIYKKKFKFRTVLKTLSAGPEIDKRLQEFIDNW